MRLHSLSATAFGPFPDTVTVDVDRLNDAGLFLLSGPTGAGKSSVLDAICFALYGDVPGDRSTAKRLRCDQAEPDVPTEVVLEATLGGRRFRIRRSPKWERPKRRGTGTTTEPASVHLAERIDEEWVTHSTRLDEAGHLVTDLLGMTLTQFVQVALLPQGRFQAFLRASSDERHRLLQRLFRTGRFEDVEQWLRDRRITLRRASDAAQRTVADLVSRASEAAGVDLPGDWDPHQLAQPAASGELAEWSERLGSTAAEEVGRRRAELTDARTTETEAADAWQAAKEQAERRRRLTEAAEERDRLRSQAPRVDAARTRLEEARRALPVTPLRRLLTDAERTLADVQARVPADLSRETAEQAVRAATDQWARAEALRPRADRLTELADRITRIETERVSLEQQVAARRAEVEQRVSSLAARLEQAQEAYAAARVTSLEARERALDVRQARLEGMAAELAGGLAVGAECPVCGSADHPHKARPSEDAPDETAEAAAQRAADDAASTEHLRAEEVRDTTTQLERAREQLADPATELTARIAALDAERNHHAEESGTIRAELDGSLGGHPDLDSLVARLRRSAEEARTTLAGVAELEQRRAAAREARRNVEKACAEAGFDTVAAARSAALPEHEVTRLEQQVTEHDRRLDAVTAVLAEAEEDEQLSLFDANELPVLERRYVAARDARARADGLLGRAADRHGRLGALHEELTTALTEWAPIRSELDLVTQVAAFCEGKAADNRLQMRLSAYVLAYRLGQVVAAANERLARMSDRRYTLEHTGRRGAGETRGGLSLLVRDDWSGEARDPATLSGGETFVVSLALALGLADVITSESAAAGGGIGELDTLFVDEGFGSLDADTLDDVMDTLDELRDGGRVVGVVSHVAEMQDRIPTQLRVCKSRRGSTVSITGG